MVDIMQHSDKALVTCPRNLYTLDGAFMAVDTESDGVNFNDTNCSPRSAMNSQVAGSAANIPLSCSMICIARNSITVCSCGF